MADQHGRRTASPTEIPSKGWRDVPTRTRLQIKQDRAPLPAAGVAFYGLLAMVPALAAMVPIYGLIASPNDVVDQVRRPWLGAAPEDARNPITSQLQSATDTTGGAATFTLVISVVLGLWSASSGMSHLAEAIDLAYDEDETPP